MKSPRRLDGHDLYHFNTCPFCIKVRVAMWGMGIEMPLRNIKSIPEYKAELIEGGGKKQVPCLRIEDDQGGVQWLYESNDIIRYLRTK